jgi:hypothetical protein
VLAVILSAITAYVSLGMLFAAAFVSIGIATVDPVARGASAGFRLMIFPGVTALWPLFLKRWIDEARRS